MVVIGKPQALLPQDAAGRPEALGKGIHAAGLQVIVADAHAAAAEYFMRRRHLFGGFGDFVGRDVG